MDKHSCGCTELRVSTSEVRNVFCFQFELLLFLLPITLIHVFVIQPQSNCLLNIEIVVCVALH